MATLYVGTSDGDYSTIDLAVKAAAAGDTIIVQGNEYTGENERVNINKSLTLKAEGAVTMRGLNIGGANFDLVVDGINFVAAEADASGATGYTGNASCITQTGLLRNVTIENCTFDLSKAGTTRTYGIFLSLGTWGFENLVVRNNECNGHYDDESYSGYGLIYAANVNNADISNNVVTYAASHAIQLSLTGTTSQGSGEQTVQINGNIVEKSYACAVYCADLHNSDMTVAIKDNIVKDVQEGSCSIYHGAIRIGACTISGVEITGNLVEGAQVGIYNGAAIKEGSNGEIEISGNALAVNQIHPAEEGVTPVFSGLGGTGIPEGTASKNNVIQGTEFTASTDTSVIYVKENWSLLENGEKVPVGDKVLTIGINAFADVNAAEVVAKAGAAKMVIVNGANLTYAGVTFLNTNPDEGGNGNAYDNVVSSDKTYDLEVNGTFKAYQVVLNNAATTVSKTGKLLAYGEAFRVMGGTIAVQGTRAEDAGAPEEVVIKPNPHNWGGGLKIGKDAQISAGYFTLNQKAVATFDDTVFLITAKVFGVNDAKATFDNTYLYLVSVGNNQDIQMSITNGAEVTFANNTTVLNDAAFGMHVTVGENSTLNLNNATFALDNSQKTTSLTNNGTVTVSGESTVVIGNLVGELLVNADASLSGGISNEAPYYKDIAVLRVAGSNADGSVAKLTIAQNAVMNNQGLYVRVGNVQDEVITAGAMDIQGAFYAYDFLVEKGSVLDVSGILTGNPANTKQMNIYNDAYVEGIGIKGTANINNGGKVVGAFTTIDAGGVLNINNGGTLYTFGAADENYNVNTIRGVVNVAGSYITNRGVNVDAGAEFNVTGGTFDYEMLAVNASGKDTVYGQSVFTNNGSVTVAGGSFEAFTLQNNGTVTVSGASTVNVATATGNGIILDSATLTADSNIGGSAATKIYGTSTIKGTVGTVNANWAGTKVDGKYAGYTTDAVALTLDGATAGNVYVGSDTEGYAATLTVTGGSKVGGIYSRVYGTTTITGSDSIIDYINAKGSVIVDDADATIKAVVAEGGDIEITDSTVAFGIESSNNVELTQNTVMTVTDSAINIQNMTIDATSKLELINSTFTVDNVYNQGDKITNNGTIELSWQSKMILDAILGTGTITIDAAGFEAGQVKTIVDATSAFTGTITVTNNEANNATCYVNSEGDIILSTISSANLYVNAAWAGSKVGADLGDGKYFGINAFADLASANNMINTDGSATIVEFESDIDANSILFNYGAGDVTFTADQAVTVKQTQKADWDLVKGDGISPTITIGSNVTFEIYDNASGIYVYYGAGLKVDGTITGGENWGCAYLAYGKHVVSSTGTISTGRVHLCWTELTVNGKIDTNYLLVEKSVFTANGAQINAGAVHDTNNGGMRYGASEFYFTNSTLIADSVTLKYADTIFNVTGTNTLQIGTVTGNGWIYMNGATLDANTSLIGANVRFASGENVVDGSVIKGGRFQVGTGLWGVEDSRVSKDGLTVTVKNDAFIGGIDGSASPFGGWVGTQGYDGKNVAADAPRYTLNIQNSNANFGYMHVSHDGVMNVTGNATEMQKYTGVEHSYYSGFLNINGVVTFDAADVLVRYTNVSVDNGSENPGKLIIKNGANYISYLDNSETSASFTISKTGIVEVNNATLELRHGTLIEAAASLSIANDGIFTGKLVTNNGTITVAGAKAESNENVLTSFTAGTLNNAGVFNIVYDEECAAITVGNMTNTGTINFTAGSDYKGGLLIDDADGTGSTYGNVNITVEGQSGFVAEVIDGDLHAVNKGAIHVNGAWAKKADGTAYAYGEVVEDGMYFGINAFATLEGITPALTAGPRTVYFTYAAQDIAGLVITVNGQSTITNYTLGGTAYSVLGNQERAHEVALKDGVYSGTFDFTSGDFSFDPIKTIVKNPTTPEGVTTGQGVASSTGELVQVGGGSGNKIYAFELSAISDFSYIISGIEGTGRLTLINETTGEVTTRLFGNNGTYTLNDLSAGSYKATFSGYGFISDEAEFNAKFEFVASNMDLLDDERAYATAVDFDTLTGGKTVSNEIGKKGTAVVAEDIMDWFKITNMDPAADGTLVMDFNVEGVGRGSQILVNVYKVAAGDTTLQTIGGFVVNDTLNTEGVSEYDLRKTFYGVSATDTIYVQVFGYGQSDYTINLAPSL